MGRWFDGIISVNFFIVAATAVAQAAVPGALVTQLSLGNYPHLSILPYGRLPCWLLLLLLAIIYNSRTPKYLRSGRRVLVLGISGQRGQGRSRSQTWPGVIWEAQSPLGL